jgi:hypothetical protein
VLPGWHRADVPVSRGKGVEANRDTCPNRMSAAQLDQAVAQGVGGRGRARFDAQLGQDVGNVVADRFRADIEGGGNFRV